ncbi:MAG: glycosyltransferase family 61 protein [Chryseolinea sp.]
MGFFKNLLKAIFPAKLLKGGFLVYNKIKINTTDKILFSEQRIDIKDYLIYSNPSPFGNVNLDDLDKSTKIYMNNWKSWRQEEFILKWNHQCTIEPEHGWALSGFNRLIYQSLSFSRTSHQRKPSLLRYWLRKKVIRLKSAISVRDTGEENYFHFYNDVLSKIFWLKQYNVDVNSIPIVISKALWSKQYFQAYLKYSSFLSCLNWVIQENEYIECESVYFIKAPTHDKRLWDKIFGALPGFDRLPPLRVFVSRKKSRLRFIKNNEEIVNICKQHSFMIVDNDDLSYDDQVKLYNRADLIVGIHGSGLTNLYFRNDLCKILEIFPSPNLNYLPFHYVMLAKMKGFEYHAILGENEGDDYSGGFYLSAHVFEEAIKQMLS